MSLLSWISGYDTENADRAAAADAELRRLNQARYGVPYVNRDDYLDKAGAERAIGEAFDEGWQDGQRNVSGFVGRIFGVVGDVLKAVLFGIPFWVWLLAALFIAWRLGLLAKLVKKVRA